MATHQLAKGLASLGRHGDSMLMHVSPEEVSGLQALGQMTGHKLHINPDTGMPEAFDFGDFFTSLLPTLVGVGLSPATGGASLGLTGMSATAAPILGGMATGALVAGAKGEDVLGGALMGGLGGYGGGNLGSSLANMGGGVNPATSNIQLSTLANGGGSAGIPTNALNSGITDFGLNPASSTPSQGVQLATNTMNTSPILSDQYSTLLGADKSAALASGQPISTIGSGAKGGFESLLSGAGKFASDPVGQFGAFKDAGGSAMQIGAPLGMAALSAMQPDPYDFAADEAKRKEEENKYRSSTGGLNLNASSGLNLGLPSLTLASGGVINANQSTISSGGTQDLYGSNDNTTGNPPLSQDGYGIGRLDKLAQQGSLSKAGDMFYAQGGPVSFADGGDTGMNLDELPSLNVNTGMQGGGGMGGMSLNDKLYTFDPEFKPFIESMAPEMRQAMMSLSPFMPFFKEAPKQDYYSSNGNIVSMYGGSGPQQRTGDGKLISSGYAHGGYLDGQGGPVSFADGGDTGMNLDELPSLNVNTGESNYMTPDGGGMYAGRLMKDAYRQNPDNPLFRLLSRMPDNMIFNRQMAKGGYLDGAGDGMSDSIPATIEGKQPARLADGEFVVPADVVSHIGNGSSKAGSKRLYAMLDKVRKARTGHTKQGKEINPNKYMPA